MAKRLRGKGLPKIPDGYVDPAPNEEEMDRLVELWNIYAPREYRRLLESKSKTLLEQTGEKYNNPFIWDDIQKKYIEVKTGRVISRQELHRAFSAFVRNYANRR